MNITIYPNLALEPLDLDPVFPLDADISSQKENKKGTVSNKYLSPAVPTLNISVGYEKTTEKN